MYQREDVEQFIKLLEKGLFPQNKALVETKSFELQAWKEAFDEAAEWTGVGKSVVIVP